jgi:hypothetical protein
LSTGGAKLLLESAIGALIAGNASSAAPMKAPTSNLKARLVSIRITMLRSSGSMCGRKHDPSIEIALSSGQPP